MTGVADRFTLAIDLQTINECMHHEQANESHRQLTPQTLQCLATELGTCLEAAGWVIATAESCTGGLVAAVITDIAGSSAWFECGYVTYANAAKSEMLGVKPDTLGRHGAVSEAVVREMACGALQRSGSDVAVAVSGIAGPGGAFAGKPVGTVWVAWAGREGIEKKGKQATGMDDSERSSGFLDAERFLFGGDRQMVRRQAVAATLHGTIRRLQPTPHVTSSPY